MAITKRARFEVFKRDGFQCQYCGRTPPAVVLEADHIVPVAGGGQDREDNLVTACFDCNRGKSDVPLTSVSQPLAEMMDHAIEKRDQMEAYNQFLTEQRNVEDDRVLQLGSKWFDRWRSPKSRKRYVFGTDRDRSVRQFLRKLPFVAVEEAIDIAHGRVPASFEHDEKCWRYFCGVCWGKIRDGGGA